MRTLPALCIAAIVLSTGCNTGGRAPTISQVRPAEVMPGALIMLSGERLDRVATVAVGGRLASGLTVINAELITALIPPDLTPGPQPLELRASDGVAVYGAVTVAALPAPSPAALQPTAAPSPTTVAPPTATPSPPVAPSPPPLSVAPPARGRDDDDDKKDKKQDERPAPGRGRGR